jgi:hypothetical protein
MLVNSRILSKTSKNFRGKKITIKNKDFGSFLGGFGGKISLIKMIENNVIFITYCLG